MDKISSEVIESIKKLLLLLEENDIHIKQALVFGSYAKGTNDSDSDIDLAIVSDSFSGNRFADKEIIRKYVVYVNSDISPIPFRTEDFSEKNLLAKEILSYGIRIV
jgi:uncharacterized protein